MIPAAFKTFKKTLRSFKSTKWLLFYDQNQIDMQNSGHFQKGAILDFQMATKLQAIIPVAFKTYIRTPRSFKSVECIIVLGPTPMQNGRHLGFSNDQSSNFDLKAPTNISRCHQSSCIIEQLNKPCIDVINHHVSLSNLTNRASMSSITMYHWAT